MAQYILDGVRVIDFGWAWAAPFTAMLLGDMGAEVIKVESQHRLDVLRKTGSYAGGIAGVNRCGFGNICNRGKLSCTLDFTQPEAVELAKRLVKVSDVVLQNFSPHVMRNLGLDYAVLREVKSDIVMVSLSGYGGTGPDQDYMSYGDHLLFTSGLASLTGHPDGPFTRIGMPYGDPIGGINGAIAALSAFHYLRKTGIGQHIDISQIEILTGMISDAVLDFTMNGRVRSRMANHDEIMAPHNCYRCKGEDNWVAIAVGSDEEWQALCQATGHPEWMDDERFADRSQRWRHQQDLDSLLEDWTKTLAALEVTERLQAVGVAATPTLTSQGIMEDLHLKGREFFVDVEHSEVGPGPVTGVAWQMSKTPGRIGRHAPLLGEHNEYVFGELLGMPAKDIADLIERRVIY